MFPVPPPKLPSDDSVTGAPQALPVFTAACNPPEGGVKRTAEVPLPLVATAIPKPLAMKCGALQVWAAATPEHVTTQLATSRATDFQDLRTSHISRSFGEGPPQRHSRDSLFYRLGPTTLRPASSRESGGKHTRTAQPEVAERPLDSTSRTGGKPLFCSVLFAPGHIQPRNVRITIFFTRAPTL